MSVPLGARGGAILVPSGALAPPPAAVTTLVVTNEGPTSISLAWTAVGGATHYDVYRSLVSGGGYAFVGTTTGTTRPFRRRAACDTPPVRDDEHEMNTEPP